MCTGITLQSSPLRCQREMFSSVNPVDLPQAAVACISALALRAEATCVENKDAKPGTWP